MQKSNTLWLMKQELKKSWHYFLFSTFFIIFIGLISAVVLVIEQKIVENEILLNNMIADILFLYGLPFLSIYTREHWLVTTPNKDPFSQRLLFLRSHPFSVQEIVRSRLLLALITLGISITIFFITLQVIPSDFSKHLNLLQYLWFSLIWTGYTCFLGGFSLFLELGTNGKVYFWVSCLIAIPLVALAVSVYPPGVVLWTITLAKTNGPLFAIPSLILGLSGLLGWTRLAEQRIRKRDLLL